MKKLGLIGFPLKHSFSKPFFEEKFKKLNLSGYSFENYELADIQEFPSVLQREKELIGLSVTIPHKESVISYISALDPVAKEIGAVNCIKIFDGKCIGYNTDTIGFRQSLRPFLDSNHTKALIFGTGGSSKAVAYVLHDLGIDFWLVSRKKESENIITYNALTPEIISACKLLVNCTPVGMWPNVNDYLPIPYEAITSEHLCYDLIYNPADTIFLQRAKERGALVSNGHNMLIFQAEAAWKIWTE